MKIKRYQLLFVAVSSVIAIFAIYSHLTPANVSKKDISDLVQPVSQVIAPEPLALAPSPQPKIFIHTIKSGENLSNIFSKFNFSKTDLFNITHANKYGKQFALISANKKLTISVDTDGQLQQLSYQKNSVNALVATRSDHKFQVEIVSKPIRKVVTSTQVSINSSLFIDGKTAGLSDRTIMQLADIFAWDIDFVLNLRKGDYFTVVYEKQYVEEQEIGLGHIMAAEFINRGRSYTAVRFEHKQGQASYYTPTGKSMRKTFLRTPVEFARISSYFNLKRKHPILNRIRAHKGVDYAARTGTPIKATGDGKIIYRGRKGGYGKAVVVQHGLKYSTLYAHMSRYQKRQRVGSRVKQGQIIGYVGKSGLATGPHLHYEFRVNGTHRNPLTVKLAHSKSIKKSLLAKFKEQTHPLVAQLNKAKASYLLAQNLH